MKFNWIQYVGLFSNQKSQMSDKHIDKSGSRIDDKIIYYQWERDWLIYDFTRTILSVSSLSGTILS